MTIDQAMALAVQHHNAGRLAEAETILRQVLAVAADHPDALHLLGVISSRAGRHDLAVQLISKSIAQKPSNAAAHGNLGLALKDQGKLDEAIAAYRAAIELNPGYVHAYCNLGNALNERGQFADAAAAYQAAIKLQPDFAEAHVNYAYALLQHGDYAQGWREYEWRWKAKDFPALRRDFSQPLWDGGDLAGRTILLHAEQGFGDTLQFVRYLPLVAARGGKVILECQRELLRLLQQNSAGAWRIIAAGDPLPAFDVHCPLLSLPLAFGTTLQNIPGDVPYLGADGMLAAQWRQRLQDGSRSLNVGLAWSGNRAFKGDRTRSLHPLSALTPLADVKNVRFVSLQKGEPAAEAAQLPAGLSLTDWTDELHDFADTAALVANVDLVITPDTAVAHLAGAMGKPVWVLLPRMADFRWLLEREDSPWYPTMRLFRQEKAGDWESVVLRVADALREMTE